MKLETLLTAAWLASSASAIGPSTPKETRLEGKPAKTEGWRWTNPFTSPNAKKFTPSCTATRTFEAKEFVLDDLGVEPPLGLLPYRDALKQVFSARQYPGSWDGVDPHGYDRHLVTMQYSDVPLNVREWIEEQERSDGEGKGLFAVYGKPRSGARVLNIINVPRETPVDEEWRARDENRIVVFAPGALYEIAPLFVAVGSECEEALLDLDNYSEELVNGGVVAYPVSHTKPKRSENERAIKIEIKAQVLKKNAEEVEEAEEATEKVEAKDEL